jgi:hypothetical protein
MLLHTPFVCLAKNSRLQYSHRAMSSTSMARHLNLRLNDGGGAWHDVVITAWSLVVGLGEINVVRILDLQDLSSFVDMIDTTEESIHLLKCNATGFRNDEDDKHGEEDIDTSEEEEGIAILC